MARRGETYSSGWLKASDLLDTGNKDGLDLTIKSLSTSEMDDGKVQRVLAFEEDERQLGLNVTNWDALAEMFAADDDDDWVGCVCNVYPHKLDRIYNGKTHGLRVRLPAKSRTKQAQAPATVMKMAEAVAALKDVGISRDDLVAHLKANGFSAYVPDTCTPVVMALISESRAKMLDGPHNPVDEDEIPF